MMFHERKRQRARTYNAGKPSKTDQAGARETDINVIVSRLMPGSTINGNGKQPMFGDFCDLPGDYREMIHLARSMEKARRELPEELKNLTIEDLVVMDDKALADYMKPKQAPPAPEEKK